MGGGSPDGAIGKRGFTGSYPLVHGVLYTCVKTGRAGAPGGYVGDVEDTGATPIDREGAVPPVRGRGRVEPD